MGGGGGVGYKNPASANKGRRSKFGELGINKNPASANIGEGRGRQILVILR